MEKTYIKPIDILLIEDNPGDVLLIKEILSENKIYNSLSVVNDGIGAMNYLYAKGKYKDSPRPDLIILDLNIPKKDGREVLAEIKKNNLLKSIPVVVMTISQAEEDILRVYKLHANCYITKPLDLNQFVKVVRSLENFWFSIVKLPAKSAKPTNSQE
jgi:two-component system, chemotaxis family, response regulator Rcp1